MNPFKRNLLANFAGFGWMVIVHLICVPLYVRLMGIEAYGLVGFYLMLQASLQILDFGLTPTMNREMARYSTQPSRVAEMRDFARTLGIGYWGVGLVLGACIVAGAPLIAARWLNSEAISYEELKSAVMMMGVLVALQWPLSLYQGGLLGLQQQVRLNVIRIVVASLSGFGAVVVLWAVSTDVSTFFRWQMVVAVIYVLLITSSFRASLPTATRKAHFDVRLVRKVAGFATGMTGIAIFAMILVQMDKVVLSKLLSLEAFGYYVLAATVSHGLYLFIVPTYTAVFPRLSALVAVDDGSAISQTYHSTSQLMTVLLVPVAAVLAFFSFEIVGLWTGDVDTATTSAPIVTFLVVGTAVNGLMHMPYALQLAYGWTSIGLSLAIVQVVTFLPLLFWAANRFGGVGAAVVWALLNIAYLVVGVPLTHRRLLRGEGREWLVSDVGLPMFGALAVALVGRWLVPTTAPDMQTALMILAVAVAATVAAFVLAPRIRAEVLEQIRKWISSGFSASVLEQASLEKKRHL